MRPAGNRSRANTLGSTGGHSRGHSRNLSASSITSTASTMSVGPSPDARRRPPPLAMANDGAARARLSLNTLDTYNPPLMGSPGPQIVEYDDATTPTSATFSTATGSPSRFSSAVQSPVASASRPVSWSGVGPTGRRLSVPSSGNPFSGPPGQYPSQFVTPVPSSSASTYSTQSSAYASPVAPNFPGSRRDSNAEADWRRRTWHPGSYSGPRPATSGLGYYQTPDAPRPSFTSQPAASQTRLPGIESFDHAPPPPLPRRQPSPMQIDGPAPRPITYHAPADLRPALKHEKRTSISWDTTLQRGLTNLEIASPNQQRESWHHYQTSPGHISYARPTTAPHPSYFNQHPNTSPIVQHPIPEGSAQEAPATPKRNKRQAWYNGPLNPSAIAQPARVVQRTSPEDSSSSEGIPTPSNPTMTEYHPAIVHSNGYVESHPPGPLGEEQKPVRTSIMDRPHPLYSQQRSYHSHSLSTPSYVSYRPPERVPPNFGPSMQQPPPNDMRRLEALVAVATGEQVGSHQ